MFPTESKTWILPRGHSILSTGIQSTAKKAKHLSHDLWTVEETIFTVPGWSGLTKRRNQTLLKLDVQRAPIVTVSSHGLSEWNEIRNETHRRKIGLPDRTPSVAS